MFLFPFHFLFHLVLRNLVYDIYALPILLLILLAWNEK